MDGAIISLYRGSLRNDIICALLTKVNCKIAQKAQFFSIVSNKFTHTLIFLRYPTHKYRESLHKLH